jgi:hypothetical protein
MFEQLERRAVLAVTFHGGQLLSHVETQAVYLGSDWQTNSGLAAQTTKVDQFLSGLVQGPYMDAMTNAGYNVGRGSATAGSTLGLSLNKSTGITDAQIRSNLQSAISSGQVSAPDANRLYVVYVAPGVVIKDGTATSQNSFLGYHGAFGGHDAAGHAVDIHYAVIAYPGSPNPSAGSQGFAAALDQLTSVSSHELAEAVTDPNVNYKQLGWYDDQQNGEIGDLTRRTVQLNGFLVQEVVNRSDQPIDPTITTPGGGGGGTTSLTAPSVSAVALSPTSAKLTWGSISGAASYNIYTWNGSQKTLIGSVTGRSATITGLTPKSTTSFIVEATDGTQTADSRVVSVTTPDVPQSTAPQLTVTAVSTTSARLSWTATAGTWGYNIYWWNGYRVLYLGNVSSSTTSVLVTGLPAGSASQFLVQAYDGFAVADSAWIGVSTPAWSTVRRHGL